MPTIYITEDNASITKRNQRLQVFHQQQECVSIPIRQVSQIIIFGNLHLPGDIIKTLRLHHIPIAFFTPEGECLGRVENTSGQQYKYLPYQRQNSRNFEFNRATAESIIWAKLHNQHTFLQTWTRNYENHITQRALDYLMLLMDNLSIAANLEQLCEYSEEANRVYYRAITSLFAFYGGYAHKKHINQLLQLGYQLLHQYIYTLLETTGLHPDYAILHRDVDYELPLAWDFTAEFSAPIIDDLVLNFARNLHHTNGNGNGNGKKSRTILQRFLQHWEAKLRTFVLHPYAGEVSFRQCMDLQVKEYLSCLLGDVQYYRPLAFKSHPEGEVKSKKLKVKRKERDLLFTADNNSTQNSLQLVRFLH